MGAGHLVDPAFTAGVMDPTGGRGSVVELIYYKRLAIVSNRAPAYAHVNTSEVVAGHASACKTDLKMRVDHACRRDDGGSVLLR